MKAVLVPQLVPTRHSGTKTLRPDALLDTKGRLRSTGTFWHHTETGGRTVWADWIKKFCLEKWVTVQTDKTSSEDLGEPEPP